MSQDAKKPELPTLYIKEWMEVRGINGQKELSERMAWTGSAISKKLKRPGTIDLTWLAGFAAALNVDVPQLFQRPPAAGISARKHRPRLDELMAVASEATDRQIENMIGLLAPEQASELHQAPAPADAEAHPTKEKSA